MTVVRTIGTGPGPISLAFGAGAVWVAETSHKLLRIDPNTYLAGARRIPRGTADASAQKGEFRPSWVASDGAAVWATNDATISRIEPAPDISVTATSAGCCGSVAIGAGSVWVTDSSGLLRLDAGTAARQAHVDLPFEPADVAVGAGSVWATDQDRSAVWRIDPRTNTIVGTITVGKHPAGVEVGAGSVWVASGDGTVSRIDPAANRVARTIEVGGTPNSVAVGSGQVWVSVD
jgi:YVTN family beta-propeller protein